MTIKTPWLNREDAATYCGSTAKTFANYAATKPPKGPKGPPFWNPEGGDTGGRVRYHIALLDRWVMGDTTLPKGLQPGPSDIIACALPPGRHSVVKPYNDPDEEFFDALSLDIWEILQVEPVFEHS
jgi:hypothetical protein